MALLDENLKVETMGWRRKDAARMVGATSLN